MDKNLLKYLSTAPVLITAWMSFTAAFIIEIQRYMPDTLSFAAYQSMKKYKVQITKKKVQQLILTAKPFCIIVQTRNNVKNLLIT